jgi:DNA-binding transcriptional ArsR family regulator
VSVDAVFTALADPTRREVIAALAREPRLTASRLAGELPVTRQAVAKHLAALRRAGLVAARREGRETRYSLDPAPMGEAMAWMAGVGAQWDERLARLAERARRDATLS